MTDINERNVRVIDEYSANAGLVLIVDDDPDIAKFIEALLRAEGFDVAKAEAGFDGIDRTRELHPDLVITNVVMRQIDGYDMTHRIRSDPEIAGTPIMFVTARALPANKRLGLVAGADDYLIKPFDPLELIARVMATLRRCKQDGYRRPLEGVESTTEQDALAYLESLERDT